jgi:hypothetical protein
MSLREMFFQVGYDVENKKLIVADQAMDKLKGNVNSTSGSVGKFEKKFASAERGLGSFGSKAKSAGDSIGGFTKKLVGMAAGYLSIAGIKSAFEELAAAANDSVESETRLSNMMMNVKGTTQEQVQMVGAYAEALQSRGVVEDDALKRGQAQLATFNLQSDTIKLVTDGMADLAVNQFGVTASGEQLQGVANVIGKAFTGNASALTRYGITLTKAQEQELKNGNQMKRAAVIAEVLQSNVGGINEALAKTPKGAEQRFKNMFGDMKETLGMKLLPEITKFYNYLASKLPNAQKFLNSAIDTGIKKFKDISTFIEVNVSPKFYHIGKLVKEIAEVYFPQFGSSSDQLQQDTKSLVVNGLDLVIAGLKWVRDNEGMVRNSITLITGAYVTYRAMLILLTIAQGIHTAVTWASVIADKAQTLAIVALYTKDYILLGATKAVTAAQWLWNAALNANPIGLILTAIVALGTGIYLLVTHWHQVTAAVGGAWEKFRNNPIGRFIIQTNPLLLLLDTMFTRWEDITGAIKSAYNWLKKWFEADSEAKPPSSIGIANRDIGKNASGTSYWHGGPTWVHERGGEIMDLPKGTRIYPHDVSEKIMREAVRGQSTNSGSTSVVNNSSRAVNQAPIVMNFYGQQDMSTVQKIKDVVKNVLDQRDREALHAVESGV